MKRSDYHYSLAPYVITTCCALHNFCEQEKEILNWTEEAEMLEQVPAQPAAQPHNAVEASGAQRIRQALTTYMAAHHPLRRRVL